MNRRGWSITVAAALVVALMPACSDDGPGVGEARLVVDGLAEIVRVGGDTEQVDDSAMLDDGDVVTVLEGTGQFELPAGVTLEGRMAADEADEGSRLRIGEVPELLAGDLLVIAPDAAAITLGGTDVALDRGDEGTVAARLSRTFAVGVAVYQGAAAIDSAGSAAAVDGLRQIEVPAPGRVPRTPVPLVYDTADPWDRRFLGEAIDLSKQLDAVSGPYSASVALTPASLNADFFSRVLPGLADETGLAEALEERPAAPAGETVVGAAIVTLGTDGTFADRWEAVFEFRDAGAEWGLVARDQGVPGGPLLEVVREAASVTEFDFSPPAELAAALPGADLGAVPPTVTPVPSASPGSSAPPAGDDQAAPPSGAPAPSSGPPAPVAPEPPLAPLLPAMPPVDSEPGSVLGPLVNPVGELLGGLLSVLAGG
ncbi:hypothetical protein BH20ACT2_BH20ACT2_10430 [soil metagenome]